MQLRLSHGVFRERKKNSENLVYQDYIHKVAVILYDNLQQGSNKPYGLPTPFTWLQLLRKHNNTGTVIALILETH